jgi:hypothetical protein
MGSGAGWHEPSHRRGVWAVPEPGVQRQAGQTGHGPGPLRVRWYREPLGAHVQPERPCPSSHERRGARGPISMWIHPAAARRARPERSRVRSAPATEAMERSRSATRSATVASPTSANSPATNSTSWACGRRARTSITGTAQSSRTASTQRVDGFGSGCCAPRVAAAVIRSRPRLLPPANSRRSAGGRSGRRQQAEGSRHQGGAPRDVGEAEVAGEGDQRPVGGEGDRPFRDADGGAEHEPDQHGGDDRPPTARACRSGSPASGVVGTPGRGAAR